MNVKILLSAAFMLIGMSAGIVAYNHHLHRTYSLHYWQQKELAKQMIREVTSCQLTCEQNVLMIPEKFKNIDLLKRCFSKKNRNGLVVFYRMINRDGEVIVDPYTFQKLQGKLFTLNNGVLCRDSSKIALSKEKAETHHCPNGYLASGTIPGSRHLICRKI